MCKKITGLCFQITKVSESELNLKVRQIFEFWFCNLKVIYFNDVKYIHDINTIHMQNILSQSSGGGILATSSPGSQLITQSNEMSLPHPVRPRCMPLVF